MMEDIVLSNQIHLYDCDNIGKGLFFAFPRSDGAMEVRIQWMADCVGIEMAISRDHAIELQDWLGRTLAQSNSVKAST